MQRIASLGIRSSLAAVRTGLVRGGYVTGLRAILRLIETEELQEAAEVVDCLDTLVRDQIPIRLYDSIVLGN